MSGPSRVCAHQCMKQIRNSRKQLPGWSVYEGSHQGNSIPTVIREEAEEGQKDRNISLVVSTSIQRKASPSAVCHWNGVHQLLTNQQQKLQPNVQFP